MEMQGFANINDTNAVMLRNAIGEAVAKLGGNLGNLIFFKVTMYTEASRWVIRNLSDDEIRDGVVRRVDISTGRDHISDSERLQLVLDLCKAITDCRNACHATSVIDEEAIESATEIAIKEDR